jgi:hypothetical protein
MTMKKEMEKWRAGVISWQMSRSRTYEEEFRKSPEYLETYDEEGYGRKFICVRENSSLYTQNILCTVEETNGFWRMVSRHVFNG